jgi:hypothetical protein
LPIFGDFLPIFADFLPIFADFLPIFGRFLNFASSQDPPIGGLYQYPAKSSIFFKLDDHFVKPTFL